ncbi:MAG: addiction module protein [Opitutae bacterium]|nr:addiction module protein [Opitutae bacterium]
MSKREILAELPKLSAQDRGEILEQLWHLEESAGPTAREKMLLDEAQAAYDANPSAGAPWSEVEARLRKRP